jgi:predicted DNA-binding protein (MmcQ/YjbR family)
VRQQITELRRNEFTGHLRAVAANISNPFDSFLSMRLASLKTYALALPQTSVVKQWGECLVFKVAGKMFLIIVLDGEIIDGVVFKCTPDEFDDLTEIDGITQAPYCAKRHWVRVGDLSALPAAELTSRIRRSYDLVVAKLTRKVRAELGL